MDMEELELTPEAAPEHEDGWGVSCGTDPQYPQCTIVLFKTCEEADAHIESIRESGWHYKRVQGRYTYMPPKPQYPISVTTGFYRVDYGWKGMPCKKKVVRKGVKVIIKEVDGTSGAQGK